MGWRYLISGIVYVISCLSLYAIVKFRASKTISRGSFRTSFDSIVLFSLFTLIFLFDYILFFHIKQFLCGAVIFGTLITLLMLTDSEQRKTEKIWTWPLVFLLFSVFSPISVPLMLAMIHFDLDEGI
jgi:hypothetical protein